MIKPALTLVLLAAAVAYGCNKGSDAVTNAAAQPAHSSNVPPGARVVTVTANEQGFTPSSIPAKKGETLVLRFTRTTTSECLKAVVVPDLNIKQDLPVNTPVDVMIKPDKEGKIAFSCWMGMFKGSIDVSG